MGKFDGDQPLADVRNEEVSPKSPNDAISENSISHYPSITHLRTNFGKQNLQSNKFNDSSPLGGTINGRLDRKLD